MILRVPITYSACCRSFFAAFALANFLYLIVTCFPVFSPFSPLGPYHSDFFIYFNQLRNPIEFRNFLEPRPLSFVALRILGALSISPEFAMLFFSECALAAVAITLVACEVISGSHIGVIYKVIYISSCLLLPTFFPVHQWDFGGTIATFFFGCALVVLGKKTNWINKIFFILLIFISFEFKPTWMFSAPAAIFVLGFLKYRKMELVPLSFAVALIGLLILIKDRLLGTSFIVMNEPDAPYRIASTLYEFSGTFWFYIKCASTPAIAVAFILPFVRIRENWKSIFIILTIGIGSLVPIAFLPNHKIPFYSWYCSIYIFGGIVLWAGTLQLMTKNHRLRNVFLGIISAGVIVLGIISISTPDRNFYILQQKNISLELNILKQIKQIPEDKNILIGSTSSPFSPFNNLKYVEFVSSKKIRSVIVTKDHERIVKGWYPDEIIVSPSSISIRDYDYLVDLSTLASYPSIISVENLNNVGLENYKYFLSCPDYSSMRLLSDLNIHKISSKLNCLISVDGPKAGFIYLMKNLQYFEEDFWKYFYLTKVYASNGLCPNAKQFYAKSLTLSGKDIEQVGLMFKQDPLFSACLKSEF